MSPSMSQQIVDTFGAQAINMKKIQWEKHTILGQ
jgi:hypothetical protein